MEMTIEEAIEIISDIDKAYRTFSNMEYKAIQKSIDTMRKYQKIEQIVSDFREYQEGISYGFGGEKYMQMVSEVLEDGKID